MKISFQIIHNYKSDVLGILGESLHLTLQDDLYNEIEFATALDFIDIQLEKTLKSEEQLCYFDVKIDTTIYDLSKYDDFISGFISRLKDSGDFIRLIKFLDEIRVTDYIKYYKEIAEIEMKIREVFSFIFYCKYSTAEVDSLDEYDFKLPPEKPTTENFLSRYENLFFYFTFTGYYQFEKPKELPIKDILPLIQTNEEYSQLRDFLNLRGILEERHIDFLKKIKEKLKSIEDVRNCISHSRAIPNRAIQSYEKALPEVTDFINDFWEEEKRIEQEFKEIENEINFAEQYSYERLKDLLGVAEWNDYNTEVVITDFWQTGQPTQNFSSLEGLKEYLTDIAIETATANFPSNEDDRSTYEASFNANRLVDKMLIEYRKQLVLLKWI